MNKLFESIMEGSDGRGRIVFVCKDENGFYIYKPQNGFKSKHYAGGDEELEAAFNRQCSCNHQHAFYEDHERPAVGEQYPLPVITEPVITEPVITEPVITEPVITEPVITEPVITEPGNQQ